MQSLCRAVRGAPAVARARAYSTQVLESADLSQRELRERAVQEALAREEEAAARAKALRELKSRTQNLVSVLNTTPSTLIQQRLQKLQNDLDKVPQEKVQQLDQELEAFLSEHMQVPATESSNRPWAQIAPKSDDPDTKRIHSTTSTSYTSQFPGLRPTPDYKPYSSQELFLRQLAHTRSAGALGSQLSGVYSPRNEVKRPRDVSETSIATLMAAGCHLGHAKASWRPSTQPFIYGEYDGVHVIDLNETLTALKRATRVLKGIARKGGIVLYVGTLKHWEQHRALEEAARRLRGYYVSKRWIPGTITNFTEVTKQIGAGRVEIDMGDQPTGRAVFDDGSLVKPDVVVLLNPVENRNCINECIKARIPTIGLCDTDMEPSLLTYPIPCNDDLTRASSLMAGVLLRAAEEGVSERLALVAQYKALQSRAREERKERAEKGDKRERAETKADADVLEVAAAV